MLLSVESVDQSFRSGFWMNQVQVLSAVNLAVPAHSIFGFIGANGAGKTTLIQLIVGLRKPTRGVVRVAGFEANSPEARSRIGYLPERPYFHEHLTGGDFLKYFGTLSGMSRSHIHSRIPKVLETVGMSHAIDRELRRYSKGMLQRIGIAQAILHDPEFLVFDEPMSGLDPVGRKEIRDLMLHLASEGKTIFFSTHVIPDVEAVCDQVALIQKGKLIGSGPIGQFLGGSTGQIELLFSGVELKNAQGLSKIKHARQAPEGVRAIVEGQEALDQTLAKLLELRAQIHWIHPIRPSLESFFERT